MAPIDPSHAKEEHQGSSKYGKTREQLGKEKTFSGRDLIHLTHGLGPKSPRDLRRFFPNDQFVTYLI
jgi:hypothetical protein